MNNEQLNNRFDGSQGPGYHDGRYEGYGRLLWLTLVLGASCANCQVSDRGVEEGISEHLELRI